LTIALMVLTFLLARCPADVPHTYADLTALLAATTADRLRAAGWEALATGFEHVIRGERANGNLDAIDRAALARINTR
jgi:hypothetical protein